MQELHKQFFKRGAGLAIKRQISRPDCPTNLRTQWYVKRVASLCAEAVGHSLEIGRPTLIIMGVEATKFQFACLQFSFFWEAVVSTPEMRKKQKNPTAREKIGT